MIAWNIIQLVFYAVLFYAVLVLAVAAILGPPVVLGVFLVRRFRHAAT